MITQEEILEAIDKCRVIKKWHSYLKLPDAHVFATWHVDSVFFEGSDDYAEFKKITLRVTFFYRSNKLESDFNNENKFESCVRGAAEFSKRSDYDSANDIFYTEYTFNLMEEMED